MLNITNEDCMNLLRRSANKEYDLTACELDKDYFDAAMKRIDNHVRQQKLF